MQAITTKFVPATNTKSERVQVKSWLGTTYYSWDCAADVRTNHVQAIQEHLIKKVQLSTAPTKPVAIGFLPDTTGYCVIVNNAPVFNYSEEWEAMISLA